MQGVAIIFEFQSGFLQQMRKENDKKVEDNSFYSFKAPLYSKLQDWIPNRQ